MNSFCNTSTVHMLFLLQACILTFTLSIDPVPSKALVTARCTFWIVHPLGLLRPYSKTTIMHEPHMFVMWNLMLYAWLGMHVVFSTMFKKFCLPSANIILGQNNNVLNYGLYWCNIKQKKFNTTYSCILCPTLRIIVKVFK